MSIYNLFFGPSEAKHTKQSVSEEWEVVGSHETKKKETTEGTPTSDKVHDTVTSQVTPKGIMSCTSKPLESITHMDASLRNHTGCTLFQLIALVTAVASVVLFTFAIAYASGFFHFEAFLGPIGSTIFPAAGGLFVFFSGLLVFCSYRTNK